jgi:hypothetical protein
MDRHRLLALLDQWSFVGRRLCVHRPAVFFGAVLARDQFARGFGRRQRADEKLRARHPGVDAQLTADIGDHVFKNIRRPMPDAERAAQLRFGRAFTSVFRQH